MAEPDRLAKAPADLVGDAHQQQAGEEQVRLLEMAQVGQPDEDVEVQEQQAEVEPAGAGRTTRAAPPSCRPRSRRSRQQQRERRPVGGDAEAQLLEDLDDAEDREAGRAHRGSCTVWTRRAAAARRWASSAASRVKLASESDDVGPCAHLTVLGRETRTILRAAPVFRLRTTAPAVSLLRGITP
jgi:hypothetical protein